MTDPVQHTVRTLIGEKIVYAHQLTVHGNFNLGPSTEEDLPLEILSLKCDRGLLDVSFRNKNSISCLVRSVDLLIDEITPHFEDIHFRLLPVSCQYNFLVDLQHGAYRVEVSQEIEAKGVDRFQVVFALGRMAAPEHRIGPWGYSLIFPPQMPEREERGTLLAASVRARLRFTYDQDRVLTVPDLRFLLQPIGYGYRAKKIAGFTLEEKTALLTDEDINVVESTVRLLASIGDPIALPGLQALADSDLGYLLEYYDKQVYRPTSNPDYYDLPKPDRRFAAFRSVLSQAIEHLTQVSSSSPTD